MKEYRENWDLVSLTFNRGTRWRWAVNLTPRPLYLRERISVALEYEAGWAPQPVRTVFAEKNISCPCGDSKPGR